MRTGTVLMKTGENFLTPSTQPNFFFKKNSAFENVATRRAALAYALMNF